MPGVPSGRACEACRRQKKKCDEAQPTCARCHRLSIPCIGSGQRRYKFQPQNPKPSSCPPNTTITTSNPVQLTQPNPPPSNPTTSLVTALVSVINPTCSLRYNLWASSGLFFEDIPSRLGANPALDASVSALTTSHASFCAHRSVSVDALRKYSRALVALRSCLDDPVKATSTETLAAVLVLIICQIYVGSEDLPWSGHVEGSAKILKARGLVAAREGDEFESKILFSLRGCVLMEALCNERIQLTSQEWTTLVESDFDRNTPDGYMLRCLSRAPILLQRGRKAFDSDDIPTLIDLKGEIGQMYARCKGELEILRRQLQLSQPTTDAGDYIAQIVRAYRLRTYGLGLSVVLIFNSMLSVLDLDSALGEDAVGFAEEAVVLARLAAVFRPVGASYAILCLSAAGAATAEKQVRSEVEHMLGDYLQDVGGGNLVDVKDIMERTRRRLQFGTDDARAGASNI